MDLVGVADAAQLRGFVIGQKGVENVLRLVDEIQNIGGFFAGIDAIEARQSLHGGDAIEPFIDIHRAQQRLIEAGLKLVGDQQDLKLIAVEGGANIAAFQVRVHVTFRKRLRPTLAIVDFARKRHQCAQIIALLFDVFVDGQLVAHGSLARIGDDHRFGAAIEKRGHVAAKVLDDDLHFLADVVRVQTHPAHERFERARLIDFIIVVILPVVNQSESHFVGREVFQHIQNEFFFDGLTHRIDVKRCGRVGFRRWLCRVGHAAKAFQRARLGRRGESEIRHVVMFGAVFHVGRHHIFDTDRHAVFVGLAGKNLRQSTGSGSAL